MTTLWANICISWCGEPRPGSDWLQWLHRCLVASPVIAVLHAEPQKTRSRSQQQIYSFNLRTGCFCRYSLCGMVQPFETTQRGGEGTNTQRSSTANTSSHSELGAWPLKAMNPNLLQSIKSIMLQFQTRPDGFKPHSGNVGELCASEVGHVRWSVPFRWSRWVFMLQRSPLISPGTSMPSFW